MMWIQFLFYTRRASQLELPFLCAVSLTVCCTGQIKRLTELISLCGDVLDIRIYIAVEHNTFLVLSMDVMLHFSVSGYCSEIYV
jgi:hypothetical protein